ncbi:MAG: 2-hydroxycarboxylate transporter family protein [Flavobacteriaceae bacterium]|nr:2-hydroxycarboxylate transporter family protein [Flavobacteriaceae bacterium]
MSDTEASSSKTRKILQFEVAGIPVVFFTLMASLIILFWQMGELQETGIVGAFAFMWSLGFIFFAIGEKLPIWREYIGGGMIMAFIGSALLLHYGVISQEDAAFLTGSVLDNRFLFLLLVGIIAASILSVPPKIMLKSLFAYIPIILAGVLGAAVLGMIAGLVVGVSPGRIITHYVLPIMGGGNGAGAIPMAEIYSDSTGDDGGKYYSFAISVLTLANIIAILAGSFLNKLGEKFPSLTGNGELLKSGASKDDFAEEVTYEGKLNTHGSLFFLIGILLLCFLLYSVFPAIHLFAWVVILVLGINLLDILSPAQKQSLIVFSEWGMKAFLVIVLVAVGLTTDVNELIAAINLSNLLICFFIICGAVSGTMIVARLFNCHPIEAAISAGLCMANRGGSGDLEVLSAARRMSLFPYAQISSRVGGGMVLMLAGYLFGALL